jgi:signal transduction histidine kinase
VFFADISLAPIDSALGMLALITVRDVSEHRRERLIAAQYLTTQALSESDTLIGAAGAVLEAIGPASGANIAALWAVGGDGAAHYVDSWRATQREQPFHAASVDFVFPPGLGVLGRVVADPGVRWTSDVTDEPDFHRKQLATDLGLHAGAWLPFLDGHGHVLGVLELLFGVVRDPDPGMLRILESFAGQLAQYLALRRSEADRQRVLGQIVRSVEDERRRIASELHDDTVQVLIATLLSIDRVRGAINPADTRALSLLAGVRETLATATERTRHLIFDLRPQLLEAEGVMPAIAEVAAVAGREAGFAVDVTPARMRFDPAVEAILYRMMQEAIVNARKHARATLVRCTLVQAHDGVVAEVADNGIGFHVENAIDRAHQRLSFGLSTLMELVRLAGGRVDIVSMPGAGSTVRIWLPLRLRAAATP